MRPAHDDLIVLRGGGDIATGVAWRLYHAGFRVLVTELSSPLAIRRTVSLSTAITDGVTSVEGLIGRKCEDNPAINECWALGEIPIMVAPTLADTGEHDSIAAVIDCRLAKRPLDTTISDAPIVVGLGPGFVVGQHCHAVIETMRGHRLGRVIFDGAAEPNTGSPGVIEGKSSERVIRATENGVVEWYVNIGDWVEVEKPLGSVQSEQRCEVLAPFTGMIRGLIANSSTVTTGMKIADIDPRNDPSACHQISDKALAIGGGVVEAIWRLQLQQ